MMNKKKKTGIRPPSGLAVGRFRPSSQHHPMSQPLWRGSASQIFGRRWPSELKKRRIVILASSYCCEHAQRNMSLFAYENESLRVDVHCQWLWLVATDPQGEEPVILQSSH